MKKGFKFLLSLQIGILMTAIALPVQAAVNIGAPKTLSGSVVVIRSSAPATTQVITVPTATIKQTAKTTVSIVSTPAVTITNTPTTVNIKTSPSNSSRSVVSLRTILNQANTTYTTATSATTTVPTTTTAPSTASDIPAISAISVLTADEQSMVDMINQERITAGLSPLKVDLRLGAVGLAKANDMKANNYFDHTSPTYGSPWAMMQQVGLTVGWAGENIAGNKSVSAAMTALMQSPNHRANILDPRFTHVGVGIAYGSAYGDIYVQEFLQE